ncbi:MAG: transglutaminase family protein [Sphingomonas sp.]|nr:transglutaminase family protein [Sphingomonas sp.]
MRLSIDVELDYHFPEAADVLLALEVAPLPDQRLVEDLLTVSGAGPLRPIVGEDGIGQRTWLRAQGAARVAYRATVDIDRPVISLDSRAIVPLKELPAEVVPYIWPSRYCESDRFEGFVERRFGGIAGGAKVTAMAEWIRGELDYVPGSSDARTTASDAFVARRGVCRDYAHLLASFARAAGIPARLVGAYAWRLDPPDFHALVEVWLDDGWHLVDATGLAPIEGIVRIGVGRDATDIAFMTIFGTAEMNAQKVAVTRVEQDGRPGADVSVKRGSSIGPVVG